MLRGQEIRRTEFTVTRDRLDPQQRPAFAQDDLGAGNRLTLLDHEIPAILTEIQLRNGLPRRRLWVPATSRWRWRPESAISTSICDKEKRLHSQGTKVLSLFFIDAVERYRRYDEAGNAMTM